MFASYNDWFNAEINNILGENNWYWAFNKNGEKIEILSNILLPEIVFKQVLDFFTSLDVENFKEASLKEILVTFKLEDSSYDEILDTIIDLTEKEFIDVIGANGRKIYKSLQRRLQNMTMPIICGSLNYCPTIGVRKFTTLLEQITYEKLIDSSVNEIAELHGFDIKTAEIVHNGIPKIQQFLEKHKDVIKFKQEEVKTAELNTFNVVFTEIRDKELQLKITKMGGKIGSNVSKKTTHLIVADKNGGSAKLQKAKELNIPVFLLNEFKDEYNL